MIGSVGLFTLLLSLNGVDFKDYTLICSKTKYTFSHGELIGLKNGDELYTTKFKSLDELENELEKQCKRKK